MHPVKDFPNYFLRARVEVAVTDFVMTFFESLLTLIAWASTFHIYSVNDKMADGVKLSGPNAGSFQRSMMNGAVSEEPMAGVLSSLVPEISFFSIRLILSMQKGVNLWRSSLWCSFLLSRWLFPEAFLTIWVFGTPHSLDGALLIAMEVKTS